MFTDVGLIAISCDECKMGLESDFEGVLYFDDQKTAIGTAMDYNWTCWQGQAWCESCGAPACTCGDMFAEHDYGETACEEWPCPAYIPTVRPT